MLKKQRTKNMIRCFMLGEKGERQCISDHQYKMLHFKLFSLLSLNALWGPEELLLARGNKWADPRESSWFII